MKATVVQMDELRPVPCPCGESRRAFTAMPGAVASLHLVDIKADAATHHHRRTTEIYLVLEGTGFIEVDGERFPVKPLTAIYLPPGARHRATGQLKLINVVVPVFDPDDEVLD